MGTGLALQYQYGTLRLWIASIFGHFPDCLSSWQLENIATPEWRGPVRGGENTWGPVGVTGRNSLRLVIPV